MADVAQVTVLYLRQRQYGVCVSLSNILVSGVRSDTEMSEGG